MSTASEQLEPSIAKAAGTRRWHRRILVTRVLGVLIAGIVGGIAGLTVAPPSTAHVGPITMRVSAAVDLSGGSVLQLPPFGQVEFDSHAGPLRLNASVQSIDAAGAEELLDSAGQLEELAAEATSQLRVAVIRALASAAACAAGGAALAGWAVFRRPRRVVQSVAVALVPIVTAAGIGSQTLNEQALRQPEFTGLLERAPYLATQGIGLADRLESYRSGVADMVSAVTAVYTATEGLDGTQLAANPDVVTVLHVSDIHLNPQGFDLVGRLLDNFGVDAVVDTGDVTTWGTDVESTTLSRISAIDVPYVFVRGNHDSMRTQKAVAAQSGAVVLDGSTAEVAGIRFAGIGDPTFTPAGGNPALMSSVEVAGAASQRLADVIEASAEDGKPVDVALIHNAAQPYPLFGQVPLVLSGHFHKRSRVLDDATGTRVMTEGSTGGAGVTVGALRSLMEDRPEPLQATLLYFLPDERDGGYRLSAFDEVSVGGLGLNSVVVRRSTVEPTEVHPAPEEVMTELAPPPNPWVSPPVAESPSGGASAATSSGTASVTP